MPRKKKITINEQIDREQASKMMADYANNESKLKKITGTMELQINKIRDKYRIEIEQLEDEKNFLFAHLEHFAQTNTDFFEKKKSLDFAHGVLGFRTGTPKVKLLSGFNWKAALKLLKNSLPEYIRTKEEADKDKMIANREQKGVLEELKECGVQVVQDETFYVVPKEEEIKS